MRDMLWKVSHPLAGELTLVGSPLKLSETPPLNVMAPPRLGQHTQEILVELGYEDVEIIVLEKKGVILIC